MKRWMNQDRWTAVTCLVIGVLIVLAIPSQTSDRPLPGARGFDKLDGAFFPEIAVTMFIVAAIWLFIEARPRKGAATIALPASDEEPPGMTLRDFLGAVALSGGMLAYVQFLNPAGYLICTIVGVAILAFICGQRSPLGFLLGAVAFPAAIFYLFTRLFMVPLPRVFF
jgi:Tripartite tricarboxylate transporter TctB family